VTRGKPRIALSLGDPAGVGPEMGVKLLAHAANAAAADVMLLAPRSAIDAGERAAGIKLDLGRAGIEWHEQPDPGFAPLGESTAIGGRAALDSLTAAVDLVRAGRADGVVFAPLNKHALRLAGMQEEDELRYM
jgi:4-hydroxythreonine-4-phosphate dehydrogenase